MGDDIIEDYELKNPHSFEIYEKNNPYKSPKPILKRSNFDVGGLATNLPVFAQNLYNGATYGKDLNDLLTDAGSNYNSAAGYGYEMQNTVDVNKEMKDVRRGNVTGVLGSAASGAAAGAAFGPWGAVVGGAVGLVGGLFGAGARSRAARKALEQANNTANMRNNFNRGGAITNMLLAEYSKQYGTPGSNYLFAANGLEAYDKNINMGKIKMVQTPTGYRMAEHNAYGDTGEQMYDFQQQSGAQIQGGTPGADNVPVSAGPATQIYTKKFGFADAAAPSIQAIQAVNMAENIIEKKINSVKGDSARTVTQNVLKKLMNELAQIKEQADLNLRQIADEQMRYKQLGILPDDNLPHAANGLEWGNYITSGLGGLVGLGLFFDAKRQSVKQPNSYVQNPYANEAYNTLAGLRINTKPILDNIVAQEAASRNRIDKSGGLSGAQRYLANVALANSSMAARAQALANAQIQDNTYKSAYAQSRLSGGAQEAQSRMTAKQHDLDYYSKAHAARQQGMQVGLYNILNNLQQYYANASKLNMFNRMYNLYSDENDIKRLALAKK